MIENDSLKCLSPQLYPSLFKQKRKDLSCAEKPGKKYATTKGLVPSIFRFEVGRLIH